MCGIFLSCNRVEACQPSEELLRRLSARGPDHCQTISRSFGRECSPQKTCHVVLTSTVLSLRSAQVSSQPLLDKESGCCLAWNGEAWALGTDSVHSNDAKEVFGRLLEAIKVKTEDNLSEDDVSFKRVVAVLEALSGPFSFVLLDPRGGGRLLYGRDVLGRRSLLVKSVSADSLQISSLVDPADAQSWEEVDSGTVHIVGLDSSNFGSTKIKIDRLPSFNASLPQTLPPPLTSSSPVVEELGHHLRDSLRPRAASIPLPRGGHASSSAPRSAVLFSGGVDCTVLARLLHEFRPPGEVIDLLNVAFENPRVVRAARLTTPQQSSQVSSCYKLCPDRITGLSSTAELRRLCPDRHWRFISIDVPYDEMRAHQAEIISLMRPHNTEMDFSIACALYFAARGSGYDESAAEKCCTPARVLMSGLGADELFAGYTRHATAFDRKGYQGLIDELSLDFHRLGKRNLGRDDRVISHWGREARYPYLDEKLLSWVLGLPVWDKVGFGEEDGNSEGTRLEPGKKILRLLAWNLGLNQVACEKKRAIQFGSRTAKMEAGKTKGTQVLE